MKTGKCLCSFVKFLQGINLKIPGENVSSTFKCEDINVSVVFIGRQETMKLTEYGSEPYMSYIKETARQGVPVFYILARGTINCYVADDVIFQLSKEGVAEKTDEYRDEVDYLSRKVQVLCARLETASLSYDPLGQYLQNC